MKRMKWPDISGNLKSVNKYHYFPSPDPNWNTNLILKFFSALE